MLTLGNLALIFAKVAKISKKCYYKGSSFCCF